MLSLEEEFEIAKEVLAAREWSKPRLIEVLGILKHSLRVYHRANQSLDNDVLPLLKFPNVLDKADQCKWLSRLSKLTQSQLLTEFKSVLKAERRANYRFKKKINERIRGVF